MWATRFDSAFAAAVLLTLCSNSGGPLSEWRQAFSLSPSYPVLGGKSSVYSVACIFSFNSAAFPFTLQRFSLLYNSIGVLSSEPIEGVSRDPVFLADCRDTFSLIQHLDDFSSAG